jgi:putative hemin transport protein
MSDRIAAPAKSEALDPTSLFARWKRAKTEHPGLHALELAHHLGVSELALLASACSESAEPKVSRLTLEPKVLLARLPALGLVKAVTRNEHAVIEVEGTYDNVEFFGEHMGQSVSTIDLRIFQRRWHHAFAVQEMTRRGLSRSLQFFDESGAAIHKVFLRPTSDHAAYDALVDEFASPDQTRTVTTAPRAPAPDAKPDGSIDVAGLRQAWGELQDTHAFFLLLRTFGVTRTQALRLGGVDFARPVATNALASLLTAAAATEGLAIMVFVGNPSVIQIFSGPVKKVVSMGDWINVLDPGFDLHVRQSSVHSAWVVRKPTVDGVVTSLELYDESGEQVALLVGKRHGGEPEQPAWRLLVEALT